LFLETKAVSIGVDAVVQGSIIPLLHSRRRSTVAALLLQPRTGHWLHWRINKRAKLLMFLCVVGVVMSVDAVAVTAAELKV